MGRKREKERKCKAERKRTKGATFDYVLRNFLQELLSIKSFVPYRSIRSPIPFNLIRLTIFQARYTKFWTHENGVLSFSRFQTIFPFFPPLNRTRNARTHTHREQISRVGLLEREEGRRSTSILSVDSPLNEFASKSINLSAMNTFRPRIFSLGNFERFYL